MQNGKNLPIKKLNFRQGVDEMKPVKKKEILKAIKGSGGVLTVIADKLEIHRQTVANCRDKWKEVKDRIEEEREKITDKAEHNIIKRVVQEDIEISKWWLKTIGSNRGFLETQKHDIDLESNINTHEEIKITVIKTGDKEET